MRVGSQSWWLPLFQWRLKDWLSLEEKNVDGYSPYFSFSDCVFCNLPIFWFFFPLHYPLISGISQKAKRELTEDWWNPRLFFDWFWGEVVQRPPGNMGKKFVNLYIFLGAFYISSLIPSVLLCFGFFFFPARFLLCSIEQANLEFMEIGLPGIKGMGYHTRLVFLKMFHIVKGLWPSQIIKVCSVVSSLYLNYWGSQLLFFGLVWFWYCF